MSRVDYKTFLLFLKDKNYRVQPGNALPWGNDYFVNGKLIAREYASAAGTIYEVEDIRYESMEVFSRFIK
jgi:hypothetical protein